jgi:hypothetical protein
LLLYSFRLALQELVKALVSLLDIAALSYVLKQRYNRGDNEGRIIGAGMGWASARSVLTRIVPLWIGTRGLEFEWRFVVDAVEANIELVCAHHTHTHTRTIVQHVLTFLQLAAIAFAALVWIRDSRHHTQQRSVISVLLFALCVLVPIGISLIQEQSTRLVLSAVVAAGSALYAKSAFVLRDEIKRA